MILFSFSHTVCRIFDPSIVLTRRNFIYETFCGNFFGHIFDAFCGINCIKNSQRG